MRPKELPVTSPTGPAPRWEYATVPLVSHALQQILNQWGGDGWELVTVVDNVAFFKRPRVGA
jgi:hypothetical protein